MYFLRFSACCRYLLGHDPGSYACAAGARMSNVDIEANLPDLEAHRSGSRGEGDFWQQQYVKESRSRVWRDLTSEGSIQEARHKNETQPK